MVFRILVIFVLAFNLYSCSKDEIVFEPTKKKDPYLIYKEGYKAFEKNDFFFASKKFAEAEIGFGEPSLSAKSAIMSSLNDNTCILY